LGRGDRDVMDICTGGVVLVHEPKTKVRSYLCPVGLQAPSN
jgi:hypothetical protein